MEIKRSGFQPSGIAIVEKLDGKNTGWMEQIIGEQYQAPKANQ